MNLLKLSDFPSSTYDKIRYSDTDRQGHVNNATFATFLETGRVEILYNPDYPVLTPTTSFVIASLQLDFVQEIKWPGKVEIGTGIQKIGNSSVVLYQQLFQEDICTARATTVIVQVSDETAKSIALTDQAKSTLQKWLLDSPNLG